MASQALAVAAVLYYVGWIRTAETYGYFGVDVSVAGLSTTDYILRSPQTVVPVLLAFVTVVVTGAQAHHYLLAPRVTRLSAVGKRRTGAVLWGIAAAMSAIVLLLYLGGLPGGYLLGPGLPLLAAASVGVAAYAHSFDGTSRASAGDGDRVDLVGSLMVILGVVALIWALALYGVSVGRHAAHQFHADLPRKPDVAVYSPTLLVMPGVPVDEVGAGQPAAQRKRLQSLTQYRYRYSGLRLLAITPNGYLLLAADWQRGEPVFLIDRDGVRIDFTARP